MEATHLAVVLTDDMLYIANGESQLRTLLTAQQSPEKSTENMIKELGNTAGACLAKANVSAFLFQPQKMADQLAPVAGWLFDMALTNQAGSGKKIQKEVLSLMRSVNFIAGCSERTVQDFRGELIIQQRPL